MTTDEKLEEAIEKLNKIAFCMGIYSGGLFQIVANIPDQLEFDGLKEQLSTLLARMSKDIEHLFYGAQV
jgi:hypothetical protein